MAATDDDKVDLLDGSAAAAGVPVTFEGLSYGVKVKKSADIPDGHLTIIKDVSGHFAPGKMTALMGPSGSGKTTLMDILAGRKNAADIEGTVLFGGNQVDAKGLHEICGYVEQFDTLVGELTVGQMLMCKLALHCAACCCCCCWRWRCCCWRRWRRLCGVAAAAVAAARVCSGQIRKGTRA